MATRAILILEEGFLSVCGAVEQLEFSFWQYISFFCSSEHMFSVIEYVQGGKWGSHKQR